MLLSLALVGVVALVYLAWKWKRGSLPSPFHVPIFGCPAFVTEYPRAHQFMYEQSKKFAFKSWEASIVGMRRVVVLSPKNVKYVLDDNFDNFEKGKVLHDEFLELFGETGIFGADGDMWRKQRKIASHVFSQRMLISMHERFVHHGETVVALVEKSVNSTMDLQSLFFRLTFDAICDIAFGGMQVDTLNNPTHFFAAVFDRVNFLCWHRMVDPFWKIKRALNIGIEREVKEKKAILDKFILEVIAGVKNRDPDEERPFDVLSLFTDKLKQRDEELEMNDAFLRDLVVTFLIAGRDTTAWALTAFFYEVSQRPELQQELLDEFKDLPTTDNGYPAYGVISQAPLLKSTIYETLRMYPSVPLDRKLCLNSCVLPDGGGEIRAGDEVVYAPWIMGRSTEVWGPDALEFNPKRWLDGDGNFSKKSDFEFPSWNAGPRVCLGKEMSILEMSTTIIPLMQRFKFTVAKDQSMEYSLSATLALKYGLKVVVEKRK